MMAACVTVRTASGRGEFLVRNRILREFASASPGDYERFAQALEPIVLRRGEILGTAKKRPEFVHFVESGIISLVATTLAGHSLDVAIVGNEGVAGIADALGQHPLPYAWVVQLDGAAYRTPIEVIRTEILTCSDLHRLLMEYSQAVVHQLTQSAVCNRFHTVTQRLSRWLLLTADRAGTLQFELTHELMAQMVGAPRSAVSQAAARLRGQGVIDYHRGVLTIRDGKRLERVACECFATISLVLRQTGPSPER